MTSIEVNDGKSPERHRNVLQLFRYGMRIAVANYEIGIVCIFKYLIAYLNKCGVY